MDDTTQTAIASQLTLLSRQYFQTLPFDRISWSKLTLLKSPEFQRGIFSALFDENHAKHLLPSERYQQLFLKELLARLEASFEDAEVDVGRRRC
jgi:hypothetical protein